MNLARLYAADERKPLEANNFRALGRGHGWTQQCDVDAAAWLNEQSDDVARGRWEAHGLRAGRALTDYATGWLAARDLSLAPEPCTGTFSTT